MRNKYRMKKVFALILCAALFAAVCAAVMLFSLTMYSIVWIGLIRGAEAAGDTNGKQSDEE